MSKSKDVKTTVRIPREKYTTLRIKLLKAGKTLQSWLEEAIDLYLREIK